MDANEITFGIEIETHVPAGSVAVGGYSCAEDVLWLPLGWTAKSDSSIRPSRGRQGCEFVSPKLKGADGIRSVVDAVRQLNTHGARVNDSTGLHVHIGWTGDAPALARLVTLVANHEKAIFASTGTKKRERSHYCQPIQQYGSAATAAGASRNYRYHVLNLNNLATGLRPTVEFRAFAGTLNITKILGAIRLCIALVERAMTTKRVTKFVAKKPVATSPIHRSGEGQTELTRLYYQLGWTKGRQSHTYGDVTADGAPTLLKIKRQLMALARKYDAQT